MIKGVCIPLIVPTLVLDSVLMLKPIFVEVLMRSLEIILIFQKCVSLAYDNCMYIRNLLLWRQ